MKILPSKCSPQHYQKRFDGQHDEKRVPPNPSDKVEIDFSTRPSSIVGGIMGTAIGAWVARALRFSSPAGLVLGGLAGAVAGYTLLATLGD